MTRWSMLESDMSGRIDEPQKQADRTAQNHDQDRVQTKAAQCEESTTKEKKPLQIELTDKEKGSRAKDDLKEHAEASGGD